MVGDAISIVEFVVNFAIFVDVIVRQIVLWDGADAVIPARRMEAVIGILGGAIGGGADTGVGWQRYLSDGCRHDDGIVVMILGERISASWMLKKMVVFHNNYYVIFLS